MINPNSTRRRRLNEDMRECTIALKALGATAAGGGRFPTRGVPEFLEARPGDHLAASFQQIVQHAAYACCLAPLKPPLSRSPADTYVLATHQVEFKMAQAIRVGRAVLPRSGFP